MSIRPRPTAAALSAVAAVSLALSGCASSGSAGSGGKSSAGAPSAGTSVGASKSMPESSSSGSMAGSGQSAAGLVPAKIKSKGTLSVAVDASYPPDESVASDGHTLVGFDIDLVKALGTTLGLKTQLQNVKFDNIIPGLQDGKYDVGMSSFTDNKDREKVVDFVTYFQAGEGYYVKAGSGKKFNGLASLCGAKVSVETGTTEQTDAQAQAKKCPAGKSLTVLSFGDQNAANLAVSSGRADVGFADSQVAAYIVKQAGGQFELSGTPFGVAPYGIALPKGNGMAKAVQAALQSLIKDGTYKKLLDKYGIADGAVTAPKINGAIG